jgi:RHS repeat-associated protein
VVVVPIRSRSRRHIGVALVAALCAQVLLSGPVVAQPVSQPSVPATDVTPTAPGTMVVPYASAGWKYQQAAHDGVPGFEAIGFNDAAWPSGTGAFGSGGGCAIQSSVQTAWSVNTDLLLRRHVSLTPGTTGVQVWVGIDNDITAIYWNGTQIGGPSTHENCPQLDDRAFGVSPGLVTSDNVLAIRARDRGVESFVDVSVISGGLPIEPAPDGTLRLENSGTSKDPVATWSGALLYRRTDVAIPGRGPAIAFARAYNSADTGVGPMGPGWTHTYNARIRDPGDGSGDLLLVRPDGNTDRFKRNNDETFSPEPAVFAKLVRNADESYTVTDKDRTVWSFDAAGRLTTIADRYGNASNVTYDANGRLSTVSDPAGRGTLTLGYTNGLLTSVTDWASPARTVSYQYDGSGRLWKVTDREGKITTFGYDGTSARLATITDARGNVALTLTYDAQGRVATQKDAKGLVTGDVTTFGYVVNGDGTRVTTITEPVTSFQPSFHPTIVDSYDTSGWLTQRVSRPSSTETLTESYTYDTVGDRTSVTSPRGKRTDLCYDVSYGGATISGSRGNLTRRIEPAPTTGANRPVTLFSYDAKDNLTQRVLPRGVPSGTTVTCTTNLAAITTASAADYGYDTSGAKLLSVTARFTDPDSGAKTAVTKYEYGDAANPGRITRVIPPRGNTGGAPDYTYATTLAYFTSGTRAGLLSSVADALGNTTTYDYDAVGRLTAVVDPNGNAPGGVPADHTTNLVYDKEDRTRFVKLPAPASGGGQLVTETRYDEVGNPTVRIDAAGQVTTYAYDERDGLFQVKESPATWTDPASPPAGVITTEYAYDAAGNRTRATRAKGDAANERVTDTTFDGRGLIRSETQYPAWPSTSGSLVTTTTYDPDGDLATLLDPLGKTATYGYDALDRLTSIDYSDAGTPDVAYGYDADGNRTSMSDGTGSSSFASDELGRLTAITSPGPTTVGYRYDLDGNRSKLIYPDATAVTYVFDKADRMASLSDWASRSTSYAYNPDGTLKTSTNANGTTSTYGYDNATRLTSIEHKAGSTVFDGRTYTLDPLGNVLTASGPGGTSDVTARVSESSTHGQGNGISDDAYMSADGRYVTFKSGATNLVASDTNGVDDVFLNDRLTSTTSRVSTTSAGAEGNAPSDDPAISSAGRYVVFRSQASNFVTGDTNGTAWDIFVKDLQTGTITRESVSSAGTQANNASADPVISADGRYVVFRSAATNLVTGDTNGQQDLFLRDRTAGTTTLISKSTGGTLGNGLSDDPTISDDGRYVAYHSEATNLVSGDTNAARDVFIYDRTAGTTTRISTTAGGAQGNGVSQQSAISADGTKVAFESLATNLVSGDTNAKQDIFVKTLASGAIVRASVSSAGVQGDKASSQAWLSADGSVVAFDSTATNLVSADTNNRSDIFLRATGPGTTTRVSVATDGTQGNDTSSNPMVSADGATTAFASIASNLVAGDTNNTSDVFVRGRGLDTSTYGYDRLSRLTSAAGADGAATYAYDPVGNRTSIVAGGTTSATFDRADRITAQGSTSMSVDAAGRLTARGADTFGYDQPNRLTTATVAGTTESYAYDGDGVRFSRQVGGGTPIRFVTDPNRALPVTIADGTRKYVWGLGLAYAVSGSSVEVYHADRLGSIRALTDATGAVTATYRTDAWGVATAQTGSSTQPFGFTGEPRDATGLSYLRARYYDPTLGRLLSRDSWGGVAGVPATLNRYGYVLGNPTSLSDPSGRCIQFVAEGALVGAVAGGGVVSIPGAGVGAVAGAAAAAACAVLALVVIDSIHENLSEPALTRPDPFPEPVPVPDPRLSPHFLDDVAFGPYDPYSGENRPNLECKSRKCRYLLAGAAAIVFTVLVIHNVEAKTKSSILGER